MARLNLSFFNTFAADLDGQPITRFRSANNQGLLIYLALKSDQPHPRDVLATLFWPEDTEKSARHNLRQALYHLRTILGDTESSGESFLNVTRQTAGFNRHSDYHLDVDQFRAALASHDLETSVNLYQGELLPGFTCDSLEFEAWLRQERENLHYLALDAYSVLADEHLQAANLDKVQSLARRQLDLEPWRESAFRQLMRAYALAGDRANALLAYERCREVLWEELGVEPAAETVALFEDVKAGRLAALRPAENPALSDVLPHNLPAQATPFIGRRGELAEIQRLLLETDCRLLTIVGLGGMGKTRTAIEAARAIAADGSGLFPDGVRFVTFAPVDDLTSALRALADALQYQLTGGDVPQDKQLFTVLSMKQMLLVMDNLEHLLGKGVGRLVEEILNVAPGVRLLVTSRERVNLRAESVLNLSGMDGEEPPLTAGETVSFDNATDSVRLFVQGAHRSLPDFELNSENIVDVAVICHLCGGMPLAIELASGWLGVLSPEEIAAELSRSLDILSTTMRDVPKRQRSLRAVFEASWQRLSAQEQKAFLRLSVFRGGFQRAQGKAASGISLPVLLSLANKAFLQREANGRFGLHEQLRLFANERLHQDKQTWREAKAAHSLAFASFMAEQLTRLRSREQPSTLQEIELELDNIRVAWEWLIGQEEFDILVQQMLAGLLQFAAIRMRQQDINPLLQAALNEVIRIDGVDKSLNQLALQSALVEMYMQELSGPPYIFPNGKQLLQQLWPVAMAHRQDAGEWFDWFLGNYIFHVPEEEAFQQWERHIANLRVKDDRWHLAYALRSYAYAVRYADRDRIRPFEYLEEALQLFNQQEDQFSSAEVRFGFGWMSTWAGDFERAVQYFEQAVQLMKSIGADVHCGRMLFEANVCYIKMGQSQKAFHYLAQEQATYRQINRLDLLRGSLGWESILAGRFSNLDHAFRVRHECMDLGRKIARSQGRQDGQYRHLDWDYFELGELHRVAGDLHQAREYYNKAEAMFRSSDNQHGIAYIRRAAGDLAFAEEQFDQATNHYQIYLDLAQETLFFVDVGYAQVRLGRTLRALGRYQESEDHLRQSLAQLDQPVAVENVNWTILALAELRATQQRYHESALLAAFVLRHPLSWLEMHHLAEDVLREIRRHLEPDFDVATAAKTAEETLIPELIQTRLPALDSVTAVDQRHDTSTSAE